MQSRGSGAFQNRYKFNGKELDEETGYYYYGARYYNPQISSWLSVDPIAVYNPVFEIEHYIDGQHNGGVFNSGNLNVFGYTYQNPIIYVDPNGKQTESSFLKKAIKSFWNILIGVSDKEGNFIQARNLSQGKKALNKDELKREKFNEMTRTMKEFNSSVGSILPQKWIMNNKDALLNVADIMQNVGDGLVVTGYVCTISVVGAEVGPEISAVGGIISSTGSGIEITVNMATSDLESAADEAGWVVAGELANYAVKKIPGVDSKLAKKILSQNAEVKVILTERLVKQQKEE